MDEMRNRELTVSEFPGFLVTEAWEDETISALIREYYNWHAPLLLAHQNINHAMRQRHKTAAHKRPDVLDEEAMQVSLVSGKLMAGA